MNQEMKRIKDYVNEPRCCGTCRYWYADELNDKLCVNASSHKCADWTAGDYLCSKWERKVSDGAD